MPLDNTKTQSKSVKPVPKSTNRNVSYSDSSCDEENTQFVGIQSDVIQNSSFYLSEV